MTSVIYFVIVRTTRKPTVDDPPKIAGRYTEADTYKTYIDAGVLEPYEVRFLKYGNTLDNIPVPDDLKMPPVEETPDTPDDDGGNDDEPEDG